MAQTTTTTNAQYSLKWNDLTRGGLLAVISAVLSSLLAALQEGGFEKINWKAILLIAATTAVSYLVKNFFTPTEIVVKNAPDSAAAAVKEGAMVTISKPGTGMEPQSFVKMPSA